jgi:hypothetical protein
MQKKFPGLALWFMLAASVSGAEMKIDFSALSLGSTPTNFHNALGGGGKPGEWKIVMDEAPSAFAPLTSQSPLVSHQAVLAQTSTNTTDEHFPLFIYDGETFKDFKISTQFKIVGGTVEQMAGMVFRFQNASNFYVVRASALGHNVRFYKMVNGVRANPIGPELDITTNTWHTLAVQCQGNQISFWLDDRLMLPPLQDDTFSEGKIGYWTKSDAVSYFRDTLIDYTPRIPAAQALVNSTMEKEPRIVGLQIYTLDDKGLPHIIASKDEGEIGQPGGSSEKIAITKGKVFFGRDKGVVIVTLPLRDRNGDQMAAVRLTLKSFFGEIQSIAISRATTILKLMEAEVGSSQDLMK